MNEVIDQTVAYVKEQLREAEGGHDWWHILRVWNTAKLIAQSEKTDLFIVELGALLHDIADSKFHGGDEDLGPQKTRGFLTSLAVEDRIVDHVVQIVKHISFKNELSGKTFRSPELDVVQDADRLDAMGAIGIARAFNYGGYKGRPLYDPRVPPNLHISKEEYKNSTAPTINHFYEKLLLLKGLMNTETAKKMADERHRFMEDFLERFYKEWNGEG